MTPADLSKLRDRANAAICSGFETELVLGRSRSTARKLANNYVVSVRASELLELVAEFERMMTALQAVVRQPAAAPSPASHSAASPPQPGQTPR